MVIIELNLITYKMPVSNNTKHSMSALRIIDLSDVFEKNRR
jgi:hypothetical protein